MNIRNYRELADYVGESADGSIAEVEARISRAVYEGTDCGARAWVSETEARLGSIVEGSEAEVNTDPLTFPFDSKTWDMTIDYIEGEASALWHEANDEGDKS